jgi:hypothetical protein
LKAPLIAVLSVGVAAAVPAVAISASAPNDVKAIEKTVSITKTITTDTPDQADALHQRRLAKRFLKLRKRLNRLVAERDGGKVRKVRAPLQLRWSDRALVRANRKLGKRIRHVRAQLRDKHAGLTPSVRATLQQIAACESHGNPRAIGGGGAFRGKYQFDYGTWASVGGKGDPAAATEAEQDRRAKILYARSGPSPWPICGR